MNEIQYPFDNIIELSKIEYFYKSILKLKNYSNVNSLLYGDYEEHPEIPRIPYLNPLYKNVHVNDDGIIKLKIPVNPTHTRNIDFEFLSKYLHSPKSYLYRYKRYVDGNYDEDDETHDSLMIGYKRSSEYIPDLKQSLVLEPSIYYKGNITKIYLSPVARVLYRHEMSLGLVDNLFQYVQYGKLYEGLFSSLKNESLIRVIPYVRGPIEVHGSDGGGNFCNVHYPQSILFVHKNKEDI
jgi:hypothetical protein